MLIWTNDKQIAISRSYRFSYGWLWFMKVIIRYY